MPWLGSVTFKRREHDRRGEQMVWVQHWRMGRIVLVHDTPTREFFTFKGHGKSREGHI